MGGVAGGALAAAVSDGGGLGVIGEGAGHPKWLARECDLARAGTRKPWGIGFLSWAIDASVVDAAIAQSPATDVVDDSRWPARYPARTLRNKVTDAFQGREAEQAKAMISAGGRT
jgi:NAD(P)H-dependent flavin oxidoreductase YrpB (nitropropane dioxygenase family)